MDLKTALRQKFRHVATGLLPTKGLNVGDVCNPTVRYEVLPIKKELTIVEIDDYVSHPGAPKLKTAILKDEDDVHYLAVWTLDNEAFRLFWD